MQGLVLEGGSLRGIFSAGVMDALLDNGIMFPYVIGVSAGAANAISYVAKQRGRNLELLVRFRDDKRYVSWRNIKESGSIFGLDYAFGKVPYELCPVDWETLAAYDGKYLVGVTNAETGKAEYYDGRIQDDKCTLLQASCAIPILFPTIFYNGKPYVDGGMADPIPVRKAIEDGADKLLIVRTRPANYVKERGIRDIFGAHMIKKDYPIISDIISTRHVGYNETAEYCDELETEGRAIVIKPSVMMDSMEKDVEKLRGYYREGYEIAISRMREIKGFFGTE